MLAATAVAAVRSTGADAISRSATAFGAATVRDGEVRAETESVVSVRDSRSSDSDKERVFEACVNDMERVKEKVSLSPDAAALCVRVGEAEVPFL